MGLREEIKGKIDTYMKSRYEITDANVVPDKQSIGFGAKAKKIWARAVYFDLRNSRSLLAEHSELLAARVHKSFLYAASKCIRNEGGDIRSFSGDSILAFFAGSDDSVAASAVRAAMKTKCAVIELINPILKEKTGKRLDFGVGVAQGEIFVVKSGIPGDEMNQDLIWIGWSTYHAVEYGNRAKSPRSIWVSKNVFKSLQSDESMIYSDGKNMWVYAFVDLPTGKFKVYKTSYMWEI